MGSIFANQVPCIARVPRALILRLEKRARHVLNPGQRNICVVFVSAREAMRLNSAYRGRRCPTNVLSFCSEQKDELGDIIICPELARQEAKQIGISFYSWIGYLFVHGFLHLVGYSHKDVSSYPSL